MRAFEQLLKTYQTRVNIASVMRNFLIFLATEAILLSAFSLLMAWPHISGYRAFQISIIVRALGIIPPVLLGVKSFRSLISSHQSARLLDQHNQDTRDTFQNAVELLHQPPASSSLILERIFAQADEAAQNQLLPPSPWIPRPYRLYSLLLFCCLLGLFYSIQPYSHTAMQYLKTITPPQTLHKMTVEVIPGNQTIGRNTNIQIEVKDPERNVPHTLFYKPDQNWRQVALPDFRKTFENVDISFQYYVKTPYATSDTFFIKVVDMPAAKHILLRYHYPAYTALPNETDSLSNGNIRGLKNTIVSLFVQANVPLRQAEIRLGNGVSKPLVSMGGFSYQTNLTITQNDTYYLILTDLLGRNSQPVPKTITMLEDTAPEIKFVYPGQDTLLTQNMLLPLRIYASDDFGLTNLRLHYQLNQEAEQTLLLRDRIPGKTVDMDYILNLRESNMLPGDEIAYYAEVTDNAVPPQKSVTTRFKARFPSIEEIYKEIEQAEQEKKDVLKSTYEKSKDLQKEVEQKRREMMKKDKLDWEDKKEINQLVDKQQQLSQQVENMAQDYQSLIEKLQNNQAVSPETLEKMERIRELMQDISTEQLQKAMENLQKSMDKLDPDVVKKAMDNFKFSMDDFSTKLEQTIKLLESIKKEQSMQKAVEIAREMEKMQADLKNKTDAGKEDNKELAKQQKQIADKYDKLKDELDKLQKMLNSDKDKAIQDAMKELSDQMKSDQLEQDMEQSESSLSNNQPQQSSQQQQNALNKMRRMMTKMSDMKSMMAGGGMMEMMQAIQRTVRELLIFSQQQEATSRKYVSDPFAILKDEISINEGIQISLAKLYSLPQILMFLSPKFFMDVNFMMQTFHSMFSDINDALNFKISMYLKDIQKGMNLTIYDLMQSLNSMQNSGSQGGSGNMQSLMQMMQQMGQEQMAMNMLTQQMMQQMGQSGRATQSLRDQMGRLAADEQRLADNLKRSLQNNPEAQKQGNSLQQMINDLEDVSRQLQTNRIDQSLIDKQERILSRLLEAQKSIHKRDMDNKRKAETNENPNWETPESIRLRFEELRRKALLQEDFTSYPREYQEVIREYLKLINDDVASPEKHR